MLSGMTQRTQDIVVATALLCAAAVSGIAMLLLGSAGAG